MSHYKSNIRDIEFNLFEVLGRDEVLGQGPFEAIDGETARSILAEVDRLAREDLAASYEDSDRNPPVFDPETHTAPLPESFKKSYQAWHGRGVLAPRHPERARRHPRPLQPRSGPSASWCSAPTPPSGCTAPARCSPAIVHRNGNDRDKKIAQHIVDKGWNTTMVLTEPDAGSDVGAGRAKATAERRRHLEHRRASSGSSPPPRATCATTSSTWCSRARVGVEGVGGPGTKGLSLFIVPKFHFDLETGELTGERNGAYVTNVEHKMGIKVSNTCELTFGDPGVGGGEPAKGWLLGEVHDGIAQMFQVIENARMMVGSKAIATLSTGYLNALEYAKTRVQGSDLTPGRRQDRPARHDHPPPRRTSLADGAEVVLRGDALAGALHRVAGRTASRSPSTTARPTSWRCGSTTCCCRS